MSWVAMRPGRPVRQKVTGHAVTISVSKPGRFVQRAYLTVRRSLLPDGALAWWANNAPVTVELGQDEHAGRVRLVADGPFRTMGPTGRLAKAGKPGAPMLQIAQLPGMPGDGLGRMPVKWEIVGDALVVILPWSETTGATKVAPIPPRPSHHRAATKPASVASPLPPPAPVVATPPQAPTVKPHHLAVLRRLHAAGGRIRNFEGLREADSRTLRECEGIGLADWQSHGSTWLLTPHGKRMVEAHAEAGAS